MTPLEEREFELHANTDDYRDRIQQARRHINRAFAAYDTPYVALSGGKDSTVLYHLVMDAGHDCDVFHFDWGLRNLPGINDHVQSLVERYGGTLFQKTSVGVTSEEAFVRDEHNGMAGVFGWSKFLSQDDERGWDASLVGIRAAESAKRRESFEGTPPKDHVGPVPRIAPIHHLTTEDVWAYLVSNDIAYPDHYDEQGDLFPDGIAARENRLVTVYDHQMDRFGSETMSQFVHPDKTGELKGIEQDHAE